MTSIEWIEKVRIKFNSPSKISVWYEEDTISNKNSNKNINTEKLPEETKSIKSKPLNEVNAENIDLWISIMNKAITDLTATQPQNKLQ